MNDPNRLLLNKKEDVLKNVSKQLLSPLNSILLGNKCNSLEVNGYKQLFGFQHSSKYIFVFSTRKKIQFGST